MFTIYSFILFHCACAVVQSLAFSLQTGSGKTYTMGTGFNVNVSDEEQGIIPRAVHQLFQGIHKRRIEAQRADIPEPEFKVSAQFLEVSL